MKNFVLLFCLVGVLINCNPKIIRHTEDQIGLSNVNKNQSNFLFAELSHEDNSLINELIINSNSQLFSSSNKKHIRAIDHLSQIAKNNNLEAIKAINYIGKNVITNMQQDVDYKEMLFRYVEIFRNVPPNRTTMQILGELCMFGNEYLDSEDDYLVMNPKQQFFLLLMNGLSNIKYYQEYANEMSVQEGDIFYSEMVKKIMSDIRNNKAIIKSYEEWRK